MSAVKVQAAENDSAKTTRPSCCFVVTGFGPFCGVPDNPTSVLVRRIRDGAVELGDAVVIREAHILETSADDVREKVDEIYERLKAPEDDSGISAGGNDGKAILVDGDVGASKRVTVLLHLGVNYRGECFHIERCAYNDATFRVPDERGYQPFGECILKGDDDAASSHELGKCFDTTLDVQHLRDQMQQYNDTITSTDPGRFVCNYTYCYSLDRCRATNICNNKRGAECHALFLHVPPFSVVSEAKQLKFVIKIMQTIEQQIASKNNGNLQ